VPDTQDITKRIARLNEAVDIYEKNVRKQVSALTTRFIIEVFFVIVVPVAAAVIVYFFSNLAGVLGTIAVGAANAADKLAVSKTLIATYFNDRAVLDTRINSLRGTLKLAEQEEDAAEQKSMLDKIEQNLKDWMEVRQ
jgi:hypothetical protein